MLSSTDICRLKALVQDRSTPQKHVWRGEVKIQPQVDKLNTIADNYDTFVDAGTKSAKSQFATIMANYKKIQAGDTQIPLSRVFDEITQFISFANAINAAASKGTVDKLKSEAAAAEKELAQ